MASKKSQKRFKCSRKDLPPILQTLITPFDATEILKLPHLKSFYYLLTHLSLNTSVCCLSDDAASNYWSINGFKVTFKDIHDLSSVVFEELCQRFKDLSDIAVCQALGESSFHSDMVVANAKQLTLLLRCCIVSLNLLGSDQNLLFQNCRVLLAILRRLCSQGLSGGNENNAIFLKKFISCGHTFNDRGYATSIAEDFVASLHFIEPSDPCLPILCGVLEVFADELLVHKPLREYFMLVDSVSSASEMLLMCHSSHGDNGIVLEVLSSHFLLSVSDDQALEVFLNRLFSLHQKDFRVPELSLIAAISLLQNPIMLSAPKFFQAYIISLVSEAAMDFNPESKKPDARLMNCYLSLFERSVIFYTKHISNLQMDGRSVGFKDSCFKSSTSGGGFQPSFESYIQLVTRNKIDGRIAQLDNSWHSYLSNRFSGMKLDLVTSAITFLKENQFLLDESCRDEIVLILSHIIPEALPSDDSDIVLHKEGDASLQDSYLLASILKLISSSILQAVWCIRHSGHPGFLKNLKDFSSCKEYKYILSAIARLGQCAIHLPIQRILHDLMETHPTRHKESKLMLLHFSGVLSLSFAIGIDFVVNGCIFVMMTIMNLFVFEESNLDAFRPLLVSRVESFSSGILSGNIQEALVEQNYSLIVASKFQKLQTMYLRADSLPSNCSGDQDSREEASGNASILNNECVVGLEERMEETCNGSVFLKCLLEGSQKASDLDDLADFIECKQGKDYSGWLRDRKKYRKWKCEKMAVLRWEKKKTTWKFMKGRKR